MMWLEPWNIMKRWVIGVSIEKCHVVHKSFNLLLFPKQPWWKVVEGSALLSQILVAWLAACFYQ